MCGIVGFTGAPDSSAIRRMNDRQIFRGPDDEGYYESPRFGVSLAMRRLSIVDLSGGHQPMESSTGRCTIVFNGEIFNAPELRTELSERGFRFHTDHSDTEVILGMYEVYGPEMVERLNGMFGFVIHDRMKNRLFGARDRFGIKPLNYSLKGGRFSFASELKSLLELPWIGRGIDRQAIYHYFSFQAVPAPYTIFADLRKIPPAHAFIYDLASRELRTDRYWRPPFGAGPKVDERELPGLVREGLRAAVSRWTLSDVPVACSLSGGIDSSAIVALLAGESSGGKLRTYSLGFRDAPELDETSLARLVADRYRTEHHEIRIDPRDLLQELGPMVDHLDEPYAGGLPSWFVFKRMAEDVKVGFTGTGGDELFGNYGKWIPYSSCIERARFHVRARRQGAAITDILRYPRASAYPIYFRDHFKRDRLFSENFLDGLRASEAWIEDIWAESGLSDSRDFVPDLDLRIQLPEEFLHMTDRFSMAHSLEARTPFLDREFSRDIFGLPGEVRTSPHKFKKLLLDAVSPILPRELIEQPKRGFVVPMREWTRGELRPLVSELLSPENLSRQGIFRPTIYEEIVRPHIDSGEDNTWKVWTLFMFQLWYRRFADRAETELPL